MGGAWAATYAVAALAAMVLSSAVPIDPPTCWLVFTIAEATPAKCPSTPSVAVWIDAGTIKPMANPTMMRGGRMSAAYAESALRRVKSTIPITPSVMPDGTMIFGPSRGRKKFVESCAARMSDRVMGRNATPVCMGV